jgi:predicted MPP superfamily phosphohydrolase
MRDSGIPIRNFEAWRRFWEHTQKLATPTDWPAWIAARLGAPLEVRVEHHEVVVPGSLGDREVLRLAFASDFHAGPTTPEEVLQSAADALHALRADLLLLGGDFVCLRAEYAGRIAARLGKIPAPLGRYAVLGNHDLWAGRRRVTEQLASAGIEMLTNRQVRLPPPFQQVSICGLDDHTSGHPDADSAFADAGPVRILLMHAPSGLLDAASHRFDLALCGHTHGGQIARPNGKPIVVTHGALSGRYNAGRYPLDGGGTILVSRGVGCTTLPVRWNCPADVILCTVRGQSPTATSEPLRSPM